MSHAQPDAHPGELSDYSVMVIDDALVVRKIIEASFNRVGMPVSSYPDGIVAIQALAHGQVAVPNIVLLDIGLPRMDGYEVAGILRRNAGFENTVIIMLSGRDGVVDRVRSRLVGARDFIAKPFHVPDVVNTVFRHLGISQTWRQSTNNH